MVFRRLIGLVFAGGLVFSAAAADIVVHIAPPHIRVERRSRRPGADYVWVSGYHRWENNAYAWTPGRWEQPPRPHAHWVAHRWTRRQGGWVMVEGHWR